MRIKFKNIISKLSIFILIFLLVFGCYSCGKEDNTIYHSLSEFKGKKISFLSGAIYKTLLDDCSEIGAGNYTSLPYNSTTDAVNAVITGNADAVVTDEPVARSLASKYPELVVYDECVGIDHYGTMFRLGNEFYSSVSEEIEKLMQDGTIDRLKNKWVYGLDGDPKILNMTSYNASYDPSLTGKTLRVAGIGTQQPLVYQENGVILGLEVELLTIVAARLNLKIEFDVNYSTYAAISFAVGCNKADCMIGGLSYTEERDAHFPFTPLYYTGGSYLVYKKGYSKYNELADIDGEYIGCVVGSSVYTGAVRDYLPTTYENNKIIYYDTLTHCKIAMQSGYIEGYVDEYASAAYYASISNNTRILDNISTQLDYGFIYSDNLLAKSFKSSVDSYIASQKTSVVGNNVTNLYNLWVYTSTKDGPIDTSKYPTTGTAGKIKVGVYSEVPPIAYVADDLTYTGFEVELLYLIASTYNYELEFVSGSFQSLITSLDNGNIDVLCGSITLNDERKEKYEYSAYSKASLVLVVENNVKTADQSFFNKLKDSFYNNFIKGDRYMFIVKGLGVTIVVTIFSIIFGSILGALLCFFRMRKNPFVSGLSKFIIILIEGVPVLLILLILYHIVFAGLDLSSIIVSIIAFSIGFMPYFGEVFRSAVQSVDKGQIEAAKATGFTKGQIAVKITLPQAMQYAIPIYLGECVSALKMTSIVGYIGLMDLTRASDLIQSLTFDALLPLIVVSLFYLLLSIGLTYLFKLFAKMIGKKDFRKKKLKTKDSFFDLQRRKHKISNEITKTDVTISIKGLSKIFDGDTVVLEDLSVDINKGDVVSIIGPSGTGKSTLIRCINQLEKPTAGVVEIFGQDISQNPAIKKNMQMVFQSFNLWSHLSVIENIILGPIYINCMPREEAMELAETLLDKVGLKNRAYSYPEELSGGQKQRVAIARALAMNPSIILFDEPTSALDPTMIGEVLNVIRNLAKDKNLTMLIVTHEMKFAKNVSNRVFYMDNKGIYEDDTPEVIFNNPKKELTRIFIKRIRTFNQIIKKDEFDYPKFNNDVLMFIGNYTIDEKIINKVNTAIEELLCNSLLLQSNNLDVTIEYVESDDSIRCEIKYDGDYNPFDSFKDDLSKTLFNSSVYEKEFNANTIKFKIN